MTYRSAILAAILAACSGAIALQAQEKDRPIPQIVKKDGRFALMVDGAPYFMLGAQAHNSSGWPAMFPKVWPAIEALHANTLEIPVYWEQFEPKPGQFDYTVIDTIVEAFGPEAEVNFHAWAVATYVGKVAAAGKAVYPLPLYANAALRDPIKPGAPGSYESGGPTDNVIPIWKVAAPALDIVAPDIYMSDSVPYLKVLELYHRDDNALFVPETGGGSGVARFFFSALGLQAIGFSPFGMDYTGARGA